MAYNQKSLGDEIYYVIQDGTVLNATGKKSKAGLSDDALAVEWVENEGKKYEEMIASESIANGSSGTVSERFITVTKRSPQERKRKPTHDDVDSSDNLPSSSSVPGPSKRSNTVLVEAEDSDEGEGDSSQLKDNATSKAKRNSRSVVWTDEAVAKLLKLLEAAYPHMSSLAAPKRAELWHCIEEDMKPFCYSGMECHIKFQKLKVTYRKLKSENPKVRRFWKHYKAIARVLREDDDDSVQPGTDSRKSAFEPASVASRLKTDEASLSRFDELIRTKKDILAEVRRHGDIIRQHISETQEFNTRREQRELDTLEMLKNIQEQEKTKLKFLGNLLDKLW